MLTTSEHSAPGLLHIVLMRMLTVEGASEVGSEGASDSLYALSVHLMAAHHEQLYRYLHEPS